MPSVFPHRKQKRSFLLISVSRLGNQSKSDNGADKRSHGVLEIKARILLEIKVTTPEVGHFPWP